MDVIRAPALGAKFLFVGRPFRMRLLLVARRGSNGLLLES